MKNIGIKKIDIFLLLILLGIGVGILFFCYSPSSQPAAYVKVEQFGEEIMTIPLSETEIMKKISFDDDDYNTFVISAGGVEMKDATCNDHICVNSGQISQTGESIVCLPHRLVITVIADDAIQPDAIAR